MKKLALAFSLVFMVSGFAAASNHGDTGEPDMKPDNPGEAPENQSGPQLPSLPDLPGQASNQAHQVITGIGDAFGSGVDGLGDRLGNILPGIGGDDSGNDTQE